MATPDRKRLAGYVKNRRIELGMRDRRALERRTRELGVYVSDRTIGKVELAETVSDSTLSSLEIPLEWEPGSADDILAGGEPTPKGQKRSVRQHYSDPALQQIWEVSGLSEQVRLGAIEFVRAARAAEERSPRPA